MPSCRPDVIPSVLYKAMAMKPLTVLDVGAGHGKWGVLLTEYLKYWGGYSPVIDAAEPFVGYQSPAWGSYRQVFKRDVMELLGLFGRYDLVLACDVIEHLTREDGERFLAAIQKRYIVTTPGYWNPQGASFGNERERHVSRWAPDDFENHQLVTDIRGQTHILGWR